MRKRNQTARRYIKRGRVEAVAVVDGGVEGEAGAGVVLWELVWVGNVAHVEGCEGCWLWDCTVKLVLAVLDDCLQVFEYLEVVFSGGQDWLVKLLWVVLEWHGKGGCREGGGRFL